MSAYQTEWPCCGDITITDAWEPSECPFCEVRRLREQVTNDSIQIELLEHKLESFREENERLRNDAERNLPVLKAALWYEKNPDSPRSALNHIRKAIDAARGAK